MRVTALVLVAALAVGCSTTSGGSTADGGIDAVANPGPEQPFRASCDPTFGMSACAQTGDVCAGNPIVCDPNERVCLYVVGCPAQVDTTGQPCHVDADCGNGFGCGYFEGGGCSAAAVCARKQFGDCLASPICACDGTITNACALVGGYAPKPVANVGPCVADAGPEGSTGDAAALDGARDAVSE